MGRLNRYLVRLFTTEALMLFGIAAFLLFLVQCLRLFDIVSDRGQSLATLLGQALLGMPGLGLVFLYVCLGIGLGRALRNLQTSRELQIVHAGGLLGTLLRAVAVYALGGTVAILLIAHLLDPVSQRTASDWTASIAADLVSRSMIPHKFTDIAPGVTLVIGSRDAGGNIGDFFADDHRLPELHRTYFAKSAELTRDDAGYVLRMHDGAVQSLAGDGDFTEVSFRSYDLSLDVLTGVAAPRDAVGQRSSLELVQQALASGQWDDGTMQTLLRRSGEGVRVLAMCLFVAAIAAFPTGSRRRFEFPIELIALGAAFVERALSSYLPGDGWLQLGPGALLLLAAGFVILAIRCRLFLPPRLPRAVATP